MRLNTHVILFHSTSHAQTKPTRHLFSKILFTCLSLFPLACTCPFLEMYMVTYSACWTFSGEVRVHCPWVYGSISSPRVKVNLQINLVLWSFAYSTNIINSCRRKLFEYSEMPQCAVLNCNNTHRKTKGGPIRYHRFPVDVVTRSKWLFACGRPVQNCATARVCSRHFDDCSYERDVQHELLGLPTRCRLRKGALPCRNIPVTTEGFIQMKEGHGIAVLLAVGLMPAKMTRKGGLPRE